MVRVESHRGRTGPRREAAARWDELTRAAAKVFQDKGYEGATIEDIASELGVLKGSIYHYVSGKHELLYEVVRHPFEEAVARLEAIVVEGSEAEERIRQGILSHLRTIDEFYPRMSVGLLDRQNLPAAKAEVVDRAKQRYEELWSSLIEEGMRTGVLRDDLDRKMVVFALLGMMNWLARWYRKGGRLGPEAIASTYSEVFLEGMRRRD